MNINQYIYIYIHIKVFEPEWLAGTSVGELMFQEIYVYIYIYT